MNALVERAIAVPAQSGSAAIISMIERAARDPSVDVEKLKELIAIKREFMAIETEQAFNASMALAQSEMRRVETDSNNPQTKSKYASYAALDRALRPIYTKHGFSLSFNTEPGAPAGEVRFVCFASAHGHTRKYQADLPADGKGAKGGDVMTKMHAVGSAMTYGQRYLLKMIFNVAIGKDDDGNAAGGGQEIPVITPEQDDEIKRLINARSDPAAALDKFLRVMRVESTADVPASDYERAVFLLTRPAKEAK